MKQNTLITGATGFIGSHLVRRLLQKESANVGIVVRESSDLSSFAHLRDRISVHTYDGSVESLRHAIDSTSPAQIFHLASQFISRHNATDIQDLLASNILFGTQLLEAMSTSDCQQLINTGTSWQHFQNQDYSPVNLYAATKQAFECMLQYYLETQPFKVVTLKLFDTYGPRDLRKKLFSLFKMAENAEKPLAMTQGEQRIDLVYIDDVIEAFLHAAEHVSTLSPGEHQQYVVSSQKPIPLRDLASVYEQALGCQLNIDWGGRPYSPREVMQPWTKGNLLPSWKAKVGLTEGIRRTRQAEKPLATCTP